ncbi:MAG: hypothetical protein ABIE42_00980 [Candidatus Eisenbacteria bacterium]
MRAVAMALLVLLFAGAGAAYANPIVGEWMYVDFDPPDFVHSVYPDPYSTVDAYIMLDLTMSGEPGFTAVSFRLSISPDTAIDPSFTSLLTGGPVVGTWDTGLTLGATECVTTFPAPVGRFTFTYGGIPGDVAIVDHPDFPRWVVDCNVEEGQVFYYCVYSFGGVGKETDVGPSGDCGGNPVENETWGSIKSMYK